MIKLTSEDWKFYNYLLSKHSENSNMWLSKEEIIKDNPDIFVRNDTSHDMCARANCMRLKLNKAVAEGQLNHLILLNDSKFKLASNKEEANQYFYKDYEIGIKRLVRYYENMGVVRHNGDGKLIDCKGNPITEDSLAKRFNEVFTFEN